jgi:hypothetical protein
VDWKHGSHRTRKSKPDSLGTNELLAKLSIDLTLPEVDVPELALQIDVPEPQVHAATLEALDEDELPDWSDTAHGIVTNHEDRIRDCDDALEAQNLVDQLTARALFEVQRRPDPKTVRHHVQQLVKRLYDGQEVDDGE